MCVYYSLGSQSCMYICLFLPSFTLCFVPCAVSKRFNNNWLYLSSAKRTDINFMEWYETLIFANSNG